MNQQIFVVGNSRSGTTMLARILGASIEAADLRELHFIEQMVTGEEFASSKILSLDRAENLASRLLSVIRDGYFFGSAADGHINDARALVDDKMNASDVFEVVRVAEAKRSGKQIPIDQTPRNVFYIDAILMAYPKARVVCLVRDPRDVCLSQKGKWRRRFLGADIPLFEALRSWSNYHPYITTRIWVSAVRAGDFAMKDPRVCVSRFEDISSNPEAVIRQICSHCELTFNEDMLDVEQLGSSDRRDNKGKTGVDASRVGVWEEALSNAEISICESVAGSLLATHGYSVSNKPRVFLARAAWMVLLPFKLAISLLFNLGRVRNLLSWARKRLLA